MNQKIEDPLFALFLRFAGFSQELSSHDEEFLKKQLEEIKAYVDRYPPEEHGIRTIEWIEQYAKSYRDRWNKEIIAREASDHRCEDCPLCHDNSHQHCEIHDQWLKLLQHYIANKMTSQDYIEKTLTLLAAHKEDLKVKLSDLSLQSL
ncbi:hypothetical protein [uncultured Desulfuromusa sp.]|uniref:hypothetical protein n=1 Tax=uncultured Desulfuromusa sp. TaxID=219183 RepID=UPI002AA6AA76|nr:hypothetical protein [uncultured Desulfuromusa sp.]